MRLWLNRIEQRISNEAGRLIKKSVNSANADLSALGAELMNSCHMKENR